MNYKELVKQFQLKDDEVILFTNYGIDKIKLSDYDVYCENQQVYYGEQGFSFSIYLAVTDLWALNSETQINNYLTKGDEHE